jgi:hypothetical protein
MLALAASEIENHSALKVLIRNGIHAQKKEAKTLDFYLIK